MSTEVEAAALANSGQNIIKNEIKLPNNQNKLAIVLHNVFTPEECENYIRTTEEQGYEDALINIGGGRQTHIADVRNNSRCIIDSTSEARQIFQRIKEFIPSEWNKRKVMGLNERLRFLRYDPGEYFRPHLDGMYVRENGERSYITVQLYLNEGFKGGETTFMKHNDKYNGSMAVVPKTGSVLIFQHDILHEGSELIRGRKYAMRTDVMFSSQQTTQNS